MLLRPDAAGVDQTEGQWIKIFSFDLSYRVLVISPMEGVALGLTLTTMEHTHQCLSFGNRRKAVLGMSLRALADEGYRYDSGPKRRN